MNNNSQNYTDIGPIKTKILVTLSLITVLISGLPLVVEGVGASFYILPVEKTYKVGEKFSLDIMINVEGVSINAAKANVYFAPERLKVLEVSTQSSIFSLWPQEPTFSNEKGEISFLGGLPSPGFIGGEGKIITILFEAKSIGRVEISFGDEQIVSNDPAVEDVFSFSQEASFSLVGPGIEIMVDNEGDPTNPRPLLYLGAAESISEINLYEVKIGEKVFQLEAEEASPWQMPNLTPGSYSILVKAIDETGNIVEERAEVTVEPIPAPEITFCPETFIAGEELLYVGGKAIVESLVLVSLEKDNITIKEWQVLCDKEGNWFLRTDELFKSGTYEISAKTKDSRGAMSNPSESCSLKVLLSGLAIGPLIMSYKNLAWSAIILLTILLANIFYFSWRIRRTRKLIERETQDLRRKFYKEYNELKEDIKKEIELLKGSKPKEEFTEKEKEIEKELMKNLADLEKVLVEELKDIEEIK